MQVMFEKVIISWNLLSEILLALISAFNLNCGDNYFGPLSRECLTAIWDEVSGCTGAGASYPANLDDAVLNEVWGGLNQRYVKTSEPE